MAKVSAGLLLFRSGRSETEVLLVHPGGPFWARKDDGVWSIPKGEVDNGEAPEAAARREFREETGCEASGALIPLTPLKQRSGKMVHAWASQGDCEPLLDRVARVSLEWPRRSGRYQEFPEVDRVEWFPITAALHKILPGQRGFITELMQRLPPPAAPD